MSAIAFDTHRIVKKPKKVGFSDLQAEAVTDVLGESRSFDTAALTTKTDLAEVKAGMRTTRAELQTVKAELQAQLAETKSDILRWVIGPIGCQTVVTIGAVVALARAL